MDVSIIIVNWNTRELLRRCLESVYATIPPIVFEIIVVDNASSDGSADMVAAHFPDAVLVRTGANLGFAAANNLGLHRASGRYAMLLNPDTEIQPGAVQAMVDFADKHPEAAVIGPKLLNPDGSLQKNGRKLPGLPREVLHMTRLHHLIPRLFARKFEWGREDFDIPAEVDEVSGACMLVRKSAIDQVGLMDERFFMYYEDVDWCRRMRDAGWKTYYLPAAVVTHKLSHSAGRDPLRRIGMAYQSQYLYFRKHHGMAQAMALRGLSGLFLLAAWAKRRCFR